ncbi:hypothetical protein ACJZ2D_014816 [Fusarium nematophilum]
MWFRKIVPKIQSSGEHGVTETHRKGDPTAQSLIGIDETPDHPPATSQPPFSYTVGSPATLLESSWENDMLMFSNPWGSATLNILNECVAWNGIPSFLQPLPPHLDTADIEYLRLKGALTLPNVHFQNTLLEAYIEYVHPYLPVVDLCGFLNAIHDPDGLNGKISLLLYHAVMFAGSGFVGKEHLTKNGYSTRKGARRCLLQKTRLIYDLGYESDRTVLIQALLIMTYWYETPDDQKDAWHWLGVAISLAQTAGLHHYVRSASATPTDRIIWKRIWWSCFMRDRLIALGMRRPTRIDEREFDVPMLQEEDFQIGVIHCADTIVSTNCRFVRDAETQREVAALCIAKAQLCISIGHVLELQYEMRLRADTGPENTASSTMMLFPVRTSQLEDFARVHQGLMSFHQTLPESCWRRPLTLDDIRDGQLPATTQRTQLHLIYWTTFLALHRPQSMYSPCFQSSRDSAHDTSSPRVRQAARSITEMVTELRQHGIERYLLATSVTAILPAAMVHLLDMRHPVLQARQEAGRGLRQCMGILERLRHMYAAADFAVDILHAALQSTIFAVHPSPSASKLATTKDVLSGAEEQLDPTDLLSAIQDSELLTDPEEIQELAYPLFITDDGTLQCTDGSPIRTYPALFKPDIKDSATRQCYGRDDTLTNGNNTECVMNEHPPLSMGDLDRALTQGGQEASLNDLMGDG